MLAVNKSGWTLLDFLRIEEEEIKNYNNVTGAFAILNVGGEYLFGFNPWRQQWELPAGGIEQGETAREAAERELLEETHQKNSKLTFKGLAKIRKPDGEIRYQAVYECFQECLQPFDREVDDEMDQIMLWDLKREIGYVDECDLKILELACLSYDSTEFVGMGNE